MLVTGAVLVLVDDGEFEAMVFVLIDICQCL